MKILTILFILFRLNAFAADKVDLNITDVVQKVSASNYNVYENALKVYQAKTNIDKARADMLPKLNIWSIAKIIIDPISIIDSISDIAPFLVPANWFRLEEVKLLYLAEKEGYRALWGNEVHLAKSLYTRLVFDENLLFQVGNSIKELERIHRIVETRERFGGARPGTARDIEIKILGLKEDKENLKNLIAFEYGELSYSLGYPSDTELALQKIEMPVFEDLSPINAKDYEFRMLASSPERRQFGHFISALIQVKKEIEYSFLGVGSISRGVAGGIFDSLPVGNGLGFGNASAIKIVEAQKEIVKTQRLGIEETLKRQLKAVAFQFNSDVTNYNNYKKRVELSKASKDSLLRRVELGENIDVAELSEVSRNQIQAETSLLTVQYRSLTTQDRLNRLIFDGDYSMAPPLIESLKGEKP